MRISHVALQLLSHVQLFVTTWTAMCHTPLSFTNSWSLLKFLSIESVMLSSHLTLCCPLLFLSIFPSIRVFSDELALRIRWPKYWSFSFRPDLSWFLGGFQLRDGAPGALRSQHSKISERMTLTKQPSEGKQGAL